MYNCFGEQEVFFTFKAAQCNFDNILSDRESLQVKGYITGFSFLFYLVLMGHNFFFKNFELTVLRLLLLRGFPLVAGAGATLWLPGLASSLWLLW